MHSLSRRPVNALRPINVKLIIVVIALAPTPHVFVCSQSQ